ncbi:MAG: DNA internalization-related competence protein ComEC/Rec2 [Planctomycetales bacterium]|nr:DNA internalization-related competence protein ComEC/Rec2 [Planctomycetales bacterium]
MVVPAPPHQAGCPPSHRVSFSDGPTDYNPRRDRAPMLLVVAALAAGIALDRLLATTSLSIRAESWWLLAVAAWCTWLPLWRRGRSTPAAALLVVSIVASGAAWHELRFNRFADDDLGWYAPDDAAPVCLDGVAIGPPRRLAAAPFDPMSAIPTVDRTLFSVHIERLRDGERFINATGTATVIVDGHVLGLRSGDRLRIFGQLGAPSPPRNPGGFDAARFARNDRTLSTVRCGYPECLTTTTSAGWRPTRWLDAVRQAGVRDLARYLDERQATLAAALVLGRRDALDDDTIDAFRATGTLHLLAISGMHVGILAGVWFLLLRLGLLPRGMALAAVVALTCLYAALTGGNPPVIRAAVMIAMLCGALALGRRRIGFNVLAAAVLVLLALNPTDLFETGPQLSVLASAVLIGVAPLLVTRRPADPLDRLLAQSRPWPERALRWCGQRYWQLTCVSLAVWIATLPLIMARFHTAAPLALVLNPLLIVPVTLALVSGFAILVTGTLLPPLAMAAAVVCRASLDVLAWAVDAGYAYTGRSTWTAGPADWWLLGFYAALAGCALVSRYRPLPRRWIAAALSLWILIGLAPPLLRAAWPAERLEMHALSVGRGLAVVLHLPDGKTLLYDAGHLGPPDSATHAVAGYLWQRGITHLDAVVLSHPDVDHFNAMPGLAERFTIGAVYVSPMFEENNSASVRALHERMADVGLSLRPIVAGDRLGGGDYTIEVLFPTALGVLGDDNANSVVLDVEYQGRRLLLTGDLESPGLDAVLAELPLDCDVLQVPHHGSAGSRPGELARWATPEFAIVSGGYGQSPTSVAQVYEAAGATVVNTAFDGAVSVTVTQGQLAVRPFHTRP